ncbi:hypothetical protein ACFXPJ_11245 [Streptomyces goshikiensis]
MVEAHGEHMDEFDTGGERVRTASSRFSPHPLQQTLRAREGLLPPEPLEIGLLTGQHPAPQGHHHQRQTAGVRLRCRVA